MKSGKSSAKKPAAKKKPDIKSTRKKYLITGIVLLIIGVVFTFVLAGYHFLGFAFFAAALVAFILFASSFLHEKNEEAETTIKKILFFLVFTFCLILAITEVIIISDNKTTAAGEPYAVVLGAGVNGETPSHILEYRINAAAEYLEKYPETVCIVSGGQGPGEDITEAECMYRELTARGISGDRIIKEDKSHNTEENLRNSMEIIEELSGGGDKSFTIVTSDFHICRARTIAYRLGSDASGISAATKLPVLAASNYFREAFGVWKLMFFGLDNK